MLKHTDYFSSACPRIRIFTKHIEFYNPGGLPKPFEELKGKDISLPQNPVLAKLFRMARLAENVGFGFDKIAGNRNAYNSTLPEYKIEFDSVILDFHLESVKEGKTVNEVQEKAISADDLGRSKNKSSFIYWTISPLPERLRLICLTCKKPQHIKFQPI